MIGPLSPDFVPAAIFTIGAAVLAGLARGFSGFGAAMVFVPLASATLTPVVAMPVLLIADIIASSLLIVHSFRTCHWPDVRRVVIGGMIGVPIGNQIVTMADPITVRWAITILIFGSLIAMLAGWRFRRPEATPVAAGVGLVSGLMSGLAQIGGPPIVMYWISTRMETGRMRVNLVVYFSLLMWLSLALFIAKGLVNSPVLWLAAAAVPGYALGVWAGGAMFGLASPETFRRIAMALVALATLVGIPLLDPYMQWGK